MTGSIELDIKAEGLTKRFGERVAVKDFHLRVARGEVFALVGPDGAGKTTVMRLLVGIMDPEEGRAEVLGFDTVRQAEQLKEHIGYMPQRFGLYDDLTVQENIAFYADLYRVSKKERREWLPELFKFSKLGPFQGRPAAQLSGGMRQKLGLICALVHRPRVLFLDEPTFGVDPVSRREFWQILYEFLKGGMTIFLSTAYMDEAERAHRVGLMYQGQLLMVGAPEELKGAFEGELLEVKAPDLKAARMALKDHPWVQQVLVMGDRLMVTVKQAEQAARPILEALTKAGVQEVQLNPAAPSLEDLFVQIIRRQQS
jgi:ABC-2 type transport system ATP-binding protein|uniref:ABC transporter ATP-binding protein n=1 Tax=Desulfobacca acetoxidans TaxID=60893 RepID=A0A7C3WGS7_9BACT